VTNTDDPIARLTEAQREVLRLVMAGYKSKEIAHRLGIGEDAVNKRLAAAKTALGASSRFTAARRLAAYEAQGKAYHLVGGQFLAVEDRSTVSDSDGQSAIKELAHDAPAQPYQVSEPGLAYDPAPAIIAPVASPPLGWAAGRIPRFMATPLGVFMLTFLIGAVAALLTHA
jgi:DNA-binding CsgD family transcriptional regulator